MRRVAWLSLLSACSSILGLDEPRRRDGGSAAPCSSTAQCRADEFCDGVCVARRAAGAPCAAGADEQCATGHCVTEGATSLCCDDACVEDCRSCLAANTDRPDGECAAVVEGEDPKDRCVEGDCTTASCGGDGSCGRKPDELTCGVARSCCAGACVSLRTDGLHCGTCGTTCDVAGDEICAVAECGVVDWALWPMPGGPGEPNPRRYTDHGDGTVSDEVTGLMWQKQVNANSYAFENAKNYCAQTVSNVPLGGHRDWRLPSRIELYSLVDPSIATPGPAIDTGAFPGTPGEFFWTATPYAGAESNAWFVSFASGGSGFRAVSDAYRVRCVR